jgi:trigger factor
LKVEKEQVDSFRWSLTVEVPVEASQAEVEEELKKLQRETQMPGFRRGKVPMSIIRKRFEDALYLEIFRDKLGEYYLEALKKAGIEDPVSSPKIDIVQLEARKPLIFKAEVETKPPIELTPYDSLTVVRETTEVTDKEVDLQIQRIRERQAVIADDHNPAGPQSLLEADLQELDTGMLPIIGHKQEGVTIDLEKAAPEFRDPLIGIQAGQSRNVTITRPPASPKEEKQEERWQVQVKSVKRKELPEIDDDFAKQVDPEINTLEELREKIRTELKRQVDAISYQRMSHLLAHQVVDQSQAEVPERMLEEYLDRIVEDARRSEHNLDNGKFDEQFIQHQYRDRALWNIKWFLVREKIAQEEGLAIEEEDLEKEYERIAAATGKSLKQVKAAYSVGDREGELKSDLLERKILQHLVSKAKVIEKVIPFEEFFAKQEAEHL